jgi:hypothetical protein
MAKIRDLLMGIAFFGKGYINAKKRNDQEAAAKMYQALQMQQLELQLEKAKQQFRENERKERQAQRDREKAARKEGAEKAGQRSLMDTGDVFEAKRIHDQAVGGMLPFQTSSPVGARTGPLGQGGGRGVMTRIPGEPRTDEGQLQSTDLQLRGQLSQDTSTNTEAIDRLKRGDGQRLQLTEPRFPRPSERREQRPGMAQRRVRTEPPTLETEEPRFPRPSEKVEWQESKFLAPGLNRVDTVINDAKEMNRMGQGGTVAIDTSPDKSLVAEVIEKTTPVRQESLGQKKETATKFRIFNSPAMRDKVETRMKLYGIQDRKQAEMFLANEIEALYHQLGLEGIIFPGSSQYTAKHKEVRKFDSGDTVMIDRVTGDIETLDPATSIGDQEVDWETFAKIQEATQMDIPTLDPKTKKPWIYNALLDHVGVLNEIITPEDTGTWTIIGGIQTNKLYDAFVMQFNNKTGETKQTWLDFKKYPEIDFSDIENFRQMINPDTGKPYDIPWHADYEWILTNYPNLKLTLPPEDPDKKWDKSVIVPRAVDKDGTPNPSGKYQQSFTQFINHSTGEVDWVAMPDITERKGYIYSPEQAGKDAATINKDIERNAAFKQYQDINSQFKILTKAYDTFAKQLTESDLYNPQTGTIAGIEEGDLEPYENEIRVWDPKLGDYITIKNTNYRRSKQAEQNNRLNAASQALIFAFNKMLDYQSVVRTSEYSRTAESMGILEKIKGLKNKWLLGGVGLTMGEVEGFFNMASEIEGVFQDQYMKRMTPYLEQVLWREGRLSELIDEGSFIKSALSRDLLDQFLIPSPTFKDIRTRLNSFTSELQQGATENNWATGGH